MHAIDFEDEKHVFRKGTQNVDYREILRGKTRLLNLGLRLLKPLNVRVIINSKNK